MQLRYIWIAEPDGREANQSMVNYAFTMSVLEEWEIWLQCLGRKVLEVQTISAEYWPLNRDAAYWMVGAYMAPPLDFGYLPRLAQQELQGSGVYLRISGPPYKGGGPQPLDIPSFTGLDHLQWADKSLGITGTVGS